MQLQLKIRLHLCPMHFNDQPLGFISKQAGRQANKRTSMHTQPNCRSKWIHEAAAFKTAYRAVA